MTCLQITKLEIYPILTPTPRENKKSLKTTELSSKKNKKTTDFYLKETPGKTICAWAGNRLIVQWLALIYPWYTLHSLY